MGALYDPASLLELLTPVGLSALLVLTRLSGLILIAPLFSAPQIPAQVKAAFLILTTGLILPRIGLVPGIEEFGVVQYALLAGSELLVGVLCGLVLALTFSSIELAGRLFGIQMGFAVANVVDPATSQQVGVLSQLLRFIFLLIFLSTDGHLWLLKAVFKSFELFPLAYGQINFVGIQNDLTTLGSNLFRVGLQIALPISCTVLFINTGLATLARTVPQMNIFMVAFILNISAGLIMLNLMLPSIQPLFEGYIRESIGQISDILLKIK